MRARSAIPVFLVLFAGLLSPNFGFAQANPDSVPAVTFDQAQNRTAYARQQMEAAQGKVKNLERKEKNAYRLMSEAQQRYEEAKAEAERVTESLRAAEAELEQARLRWQQESTQLMRIYEQDQARQRER
ncbi:MAG: hypothetical protein ACREUQ_12780 [Burkholderiales bacterium]